MPSIQIADKPTLDRVNSDITDSTHGLSALSEALKNSTPDKTIGYSFVVLPIEQRLNFISNYQKKGYLEESVFLSIINSKQLDSIPIGTIVKLPNSVSKNSYWVVADKEHDDVPNTVDLIPIDLVEEGKSFSDNSETGYKDSSIRSWLNGEFLRGFSSSIQNKMMDMDVVTYVEGNLINDIYTDKVKLLSAVEVGIYNSYSASISETFDRDEGDSYPIFKYPKYRCKKSVNGGDAKNFWLRTSGLNTSSQLGVSVTGDYHVFTDKTDTDSGILPCIRIKGTDGSTNEFVEIANNTLSLSHDIYDSISTYEQKVTEQADIASNATTSNEALNAALVAGEFAEKADLEYNQLDEYIIEAEELINESYELGNLIAAAYDSAKESVESTSDNVDAADANLVNAKKATTSEEAEPYVLNAEEQASIARASVTKEEETESNVSLEIESYKQTNIDKINNGLLDLANNALDSAIEAYDSTLEDANTATEKANEAANASKSIDAKNATTSAEYSAKNARSAYKNIETLISDTETKINETYRKYE